MVKNLTWNGSSPNQILRQKLSLYATHWSKAQHFIQKLPRIWCLKKWILWKMRFWNCECCDKLVSKKLWIWKMKLSKCEFLEKCRIFAPVCATYSYLEKSINCRKCTKLAIWNFLNASLERSLGYLYSCSSSSSCDLSQIILEYSWS